MSLQARALGSARGGGTLGGGTWVVALGWPCAPWGWRCPSARGWSWPAPCPGGTSGVALPKGYFHPKMEPEQRLLGAPIPGAGGAPGGAPRSRAERGPHRRERATGPRDRRGHTGGPWHGRCQTPSPARQARPWDQLGTVAMCRWPPAPAAFLPSRLRRGREFGQTKGTVCPAPPPHAAPSSPIAKLNVPFQTRAPSTPWPPTAPAAWRPLARGRDAAGIIRCCLLLNLSPRPASTLRHAAGPRAPPALHAARSRPVTGSHHVAGHQGHQQPPPPRAPLGAG